MSEMSNDSNETRLRTLVHSYTRDSLSALEELSSLLKVNGSGTRCRSLSTSTITVFRDPFLLNMLVKCGYFELL